MEGRKVNSGRSLGRAQRTEQSCGVKIAPSLMCADLSQLGKEIRRLEKGGCDLFHFDIMDGHFVPNLTFGPPVVASLRDKTNLPFDIHLMIENPENYLSQFIKAGGDIISLPVESCLHLNRAVSLIKDAGVKASVALSPATPLSSIEYILEDLDMVLLMTVNPGFVGQSFIPQVLPKIKRLREMLREKNLSLDIEVDGNINKRTAPAVISAGANILVGGTSSIFKSKRGVGRVIRGLRGQIVHSP